MNPIDSTAEWIEADGIGGFASGTVSGIRSRRYQALLLTATTPPAGRMGLVNGFDAWVETPRGTFAISSQRYGPDVIHPDGATRIESFEYEPWPRWRYKIDNDLFVEQELICDVFASNLWRNALLTSRTMHFHAACSVLGTRGEPDEARIPELHHACRLVQQEPWTRFAAVTWSNQ